MSIYIYILVYVNPFTIQNDGNYWISHVFHSMRSAWVEVRVLLWKALRSVEAEQEHPACSCTQAEPKCHYESEG